MTLALLAWPKPVRRIRSNRANHSGLESHRSYSHLREPCLSEVRGDLFTSRRRGLVRCSGTARLVSDGDATSRAHHAAQLLETIDRLAPEHDRVDGQNLVERFREGRQA